MSDEQILISVSLKGVKFQHGIQSPSTCGQSMLQLVKNSLYPAGKYT